VSTGSALGGRIGVCQSGGLSALAVAVWLHERGADAHHYIADLGQSPRQELDALASSLERRGMRAEVVDLRGPMAELTSELLRYRARHDGGYWNTVSGSRLVLVRELAPRMREDGCDLLAHGCVGGGNDQRRFARYTEALAPDLRVYAPWTDPAALDRFPDRATMLRAVVGQSLRLDPGSSDDRSVDANLAGASHEGGTLEDLRTPVTAISPRWSTWPADAPVDAETLTVRFERGRVVRAGDSGPEPPAWLGRAHQAGARNGVWLRDVLESRIIGTRCRGIYEAPALEVLDAAWERVLEVALDRPARRLYDQLSAQLGEAVYEARYLEPAAKAARAALESLLEPASATVTLNVHRGSVMVTSVDVPGEVANQQRRFAAGGHRWAEPVRGALVATSTSP
jgi:argininosuccinate synthase